MCKLIMLDNNLRIADIKEDAIKNIIDAAPLCPDISQIILFGSSIREDCNADSDIDIAIFGKKVKSRMFRTKSYNNFLSRLYNYNNFGENYDILYFKDGYDDETMIMQQIKQGIKIYDNNKFNNANDIQSNRPAPFIVSGSLIKPTAKEIEIRKKKIKRAEEIGSSITKFDIEGESENPYRVQALIYIHKGLEVPKELKEKIEEFDKDRG